MKKDTPTTTPKQRGRRPIPDEFRKVAITIFVQKRYFNAARLELKEMERKYNAIPNHADAHESGVVSG